MNLKLKNLKVVFKLQLLLICRVDPSLRIVDDLVHFSQVERKEEQRREGVEQKVAEAGHQRLQDSK